MLSNSSTRLYTFFRFNRFKRAQNSVFGRCFLPLAIVMASGKYTRFHFTTEIWVNTPRNKGLSPIETF